MGEIIPYPVYGSNMKLVTILIGLMTELIALCLLVWSGISAHIGHVHKDVDDALRNSQESSRGEFLNEALENNGYWKALRVVKAIDICCAVVNAAQCIFSLLMIIGALTGRARALRAWLLFSACWVLANALLVPLMAVLSLMLASQISGSVIVIIMAVALPGEVYCMLMVRRYYKELLDSQRHNVDYHSQVRLTVNG